MKIREYKNDDFEGLKELYFDGRKRELSYAKIENIIPLEKDATKLKKFNEGIKLIAEVEGEIAGFVCINSPEVSLIYVDKRFLGQGIGRKLLVLAIEKIKLIKKEDEKVELDLLNINIAAKNLYTSVGFKTENEFGRVIDNKEVTITHMVL